MAFFDSLLSGALGLFGTGLTNDTNKRIADENLGYQRERNRIEDARYNSETRYAREFAEEDRAFNRLWAQDERNYARSFAEDEREYNRALQQEIFNREDTALERQAASLSSMGINPLSQNMSGLGAGQVVSSATPAAAAGVSNTSAPANSNQKGQALHNDYKMENLLNDISPMMSLFDGINGIATGMNERDLLRQQNDYQRLLNQAQAIENSQKAIELQKRLENLDADTANKKSNTKTTEELRPYEVEDKKASAERNQRENVFQETYGSHDLMNTTARLVTDLAGISTSDKLTPDALEKSTGKTSPAKKYLNSGLSALEHTTDVISKVLDNTLGKGARYIYNFFTKSKTKTSSSEWKRAQDR